MGSAEPNTPTLKTLVGSPVDAQDATSTHVRPIPLATPLTAVGSACTSTATTRNPTTTLPRRPRTVTAATRGLGDADRLVLHQRGLFKTRHMVDIKKCHSRDTRTLLNAHRGTATRETLTPTAGASSTRSKTK